MTSRLFRKCRMLVVGALAISALAASPALAGHGSTTSYLCSVTPSSVANGSTYVVSGSGFLSITSVNVYIKNRAAKFIVPIVPVGADGTFITPQLIAQFSTTGTMTVSIANAYDRRQKILAQCAFTVY